jgi:hypothetical protein
VIGAALVRLVRIAVGYLNIFGAINLDLPEFLAIRSVIIDALLR